MTGEHGGWLRSQHPLLLHDSAAQRQTWTVAWIRAALVRREKIYYTCSGDGIPEPLLEALVLPAQWSPAPGQVEVIDAQELRSQTGGEPDALSDWHRGLAVRALDDGHHGAAFVTDQEALRAVLPQDADLIEHEQRLERLTDLAGMRVLCRYDPRTAGRPLVGRLLQLHHRNVSDSVWGADVTEDRVCICGEIDAFTADLLLEVLHAAAARGITEFDLGGIQLLSAHGMAALVRVADELPAGSRLRLVNVPVMVLRLLALTGLAHHPRIDLVEGIRAVQDVGPDAGAGSGTDAGSGLVSAGA